MQIGSSMAATAASFGTPKKPTNSAASDPLMSVAPSSSDSKTDELTRFLKMTPAQKMQYQWLNAHKVTQQDLASMTSDQRKSIQDQMTQDLKQQARQDTESKAAKANGGVNLMV